MSQISNVSLQIPNESLNYKALAGNAEILHTQLRQRVLQEYAVPWTNFRVWDAYHTNAVGTAATDDLALNTGTWGTDSAHLYAGDCKNLGPTTRRVVFFMPIPPEYEDGETIQIRVRAAMETTVASVSCTVDLEAYVSDGDGTVNASDLITTSATSMNSLTPADYDFTVTAASVNPGDMLEVRLTIACNDSATATVVGPAVYNVSLLCDTRG
jgi:hypothetical protein